MGIDRTVQITLISSTTLALLSAYLLFKRFKSKTPTEWVSVGTVRKLHIYPLKSGRRIELNEGEFTDVGLKVTEDEYELKLRDRQFVVYGAEDNQFRTARTYPKMVLIEISVVGDNTVAFNAPDMPTLLVKIPHRKEDQLVPIECWGKERITGIDCGDKAAIWFSKYMANNEKQFRLAFNDAKVKRDITKTHQKLLNYYKNLSNKSTGLFADLSCALLINQKSVDDLNEKIGNSTVTAENFRSNIVIDGDALKAFEEDAWDWIKIGNDVIFRSVKECTRCTLPTISPETGIRDVAREPMKTLETYRISKGPEKVPVMGINLELRSRGAIKIGDNVYIPKTV